MLLYGGPTTSVGNGDVYDFIAVELAGAKVLVSLSLGDRNEIVRVGVTGGMALNDGEWHHVEVYRNGTVSYTLNRPLTVSGHMVPETSCWRANCAPGHPKQRKFN